MSEVGELLAGRYRLRRRLGNGAMGIVWKAIDQRLKRPVAIKELRLPAELSEDEADEARLRAMREGRIAARLHHPNAIAVHDVDEHRGLPLLVMEYFPARSLADILVTEGPLSPVRAAEVGAQVAAALSDAHEAGIVHRDVKPGNVLIADDGSVKLGDFGISHASDDVTVTQSGVVPGTPAYFAPEIARGRGAAPSSDIFSLGATLYAAVEGTPPFGDDENSIALLHRVAAGDLAPPSHAGPLTDVLLAMLARDPDDRPTARQVQDAARAVAAGEPALVASGHVAVPATVPDATSVSPTMPVRPLGDRPGTRLDLRPAPDPPEHGPGGDLPRRNWPWGAAAAALLAAIVAVVVAITGGPDGETAIADRPSTSAPATTAHPVTAADMRAVTLDFYGLLPDRTDSAWRYLGPALRSQGHAAFADNWSRVEAVTVISTPRITGDRTVHVGIELSLADGGTVTEFHQLGFVPSDGPPLINSDTVLRRESTAPAPPPRTSATPPQDQREGPGPGEEDRKPKKPKEDHGNGRGRD